MKFSVGIEKFIKFLVLIFLLCSQNIVIRYIFLSRGFGARSAFIAANIIPHHNLKLVSLDVTTFISRK